jgi:hypothetical protein
MKYLLSIMFLTFVIGCSSKKNIPTKVSYGGEVKFESLVIDLGSIKLGDKITKVIEFKNIGKEILIPHLAKSSGSGLIASVSRDEIPPRGIGKIWLEYDTQNMQLKSMDKYTIRRSITITSSASNNPIVLKVAGTVIK